MKQIPASLLTLLAGVVVTLISIWVGQHHGLLPEQASEQAPLVDDFFNVMVTIATALFWVAQGVMVLFIIDATALQIAHQVIAQISQQEGLPDDWEALAPILSQRKEEADIRLYLNAYAALGLILARLGAIEEATVITARVSAIDDKREFEAATMWQILTHPDDEED